MDMLIFFQALLIGIIEGFTEFIPVSSTGHMILVIDLLKFQAPPGKVFEIIIQLGAILAVCCLYRQKIFDVIFNIHKDKKAQTFSLSVILAFLPAAFLGAYFHSFIKEVLFSPTVVAISLIIGGIIIIIVEKLNIEPKHDDIDELPKLTAIKIGFAQCIAMIPGVSRSGATIMGALLCKVERKVATEFSFFLAIPTMFGATFYDIYKNYNYLNIENAVVIFIGFISAFITALFVVKAVINFISNHGFIPFAIYRIVLGVVILFFIIN